MADATPNSSDATPTVPDAPPKPPPRDTSLINITDWERREPPAASGKREDRFQALVRQSVLNAVHRHGQSAADIEVCGVLVGNVYHDAAGPWLYVEHAIEGNGATQRAAQVTFTAETWQHIQSIMDRDYPDKRILGWYHTHPGFGIFLSDMDVFIQENFFPEPWQIALVYDPKAKEEGLFFWRNGRPDTDRFLLETDAAVVEHTRTVREAKAVTPRATTGGMVGDITQYVDRLDAIEKRQKLILAVLALLALIAVAWPLVVTAFLPDLLKQHAPPAPIELPENDPLKRAPKL
jgi:proteasome lid subunit RPN8/RPN11